VYDQANRLVNSGGGHTFTYDGDGLRASSTTGPDTTAFTWDQSASLPVLLQAGTTSYLYGPDGNPIEQIDGSTPLFFLHDQQGSTRILTDGQGIARGTYSYDTWGAAVSHTGTALTDLQYNGEYTDASTGLQYLRARYYDPSTGQFITPDPALGASGARYAYAGDSPVNAADPTGLCLLGHDPNGRCRGSNPANDLHFVGTTATVTGIVAGVVIISVGTGGVADEVALGATVVGGVATAGGAAIDCTKKFVSYQCAADAGSVVLTIGAIGIGTKVQDAYKGLYGAETGLGSLFYDRVTGDFAPGDGASGSGGGTDCGSGGFYYPQAPSGEFLQPSANGSLLQP
jgi:RHS repeat-associated protein